MKTLAQEHVRHALTTMLGSLIASFFFISGVSIAQEVEPNDTAINAQILSGLSVPADQVVISAMMGSSSGTSTDLDLYSFDGSAGDVPNIQVVTDAAWDSLVVLYDSNGQILDQNDDAFTMNPGSISSADSRIDAHPLSADGTYYVAVTSLPRYLGANFMPFDPTVEAMGGSYELRVSGVTGQAEPTGLPDPGPVGDEGGDDGDDMMAIAIEVRHWNGSDADINKRWKRHMKRMGKRRGIYPVPVVMLSSKDFDAMSVDEESLTFGAVGDEDSLFRCSKRARDVNRDGMNDKMCFFDAFKTNFGVGDVQGRLNGMTKDGQAFESSASLKIFKVSKEKRKSWHERHNRDAHDGDRHHRRHHGHRHHSKRW
jgi:hypothetical protein